MEKCQICYDEQNSDSPQVNELPCGHFAHTSCLELVNDSSHGCFVEGCDGEPNPYHGMDLSIVYQVLEAVSNEIIPYKRDPMIELTKNHLVDLMENWPASIAWLESFEQVMLDLSQLAAQDLIERGLCNDKLTKLGGHESNRIKSNLSIQRWVDHTVKQLDKATEGTKRPLILLSTVDAFKGFVLEFMPLLTHEFNSMRKFSSLPPSSEGVMVLKRLQFSGYDFYATAHHDNRIEVLGLNSSHIHLGLPLYEVNISHQLEHEINYWRSYRPSLDLNIFIINETVYVRALVCLKEKTFRCSYTISIRDKRNDLTFVTDILLAKLPLMR